MSAELSLYPIQDLIEEFKRRNISFVLGYVDHQQFTKQESIAQEIVWGCDSGGNLVLQEALMTFLNEWHRTIRTQGCAPEAGAPHDPD